MRIIITSNGQKYFYYSPITIPQKLNKIAQKINSRAKRVNQNINVGKIIEDKKVNNNISINDESKLPSLSNSNYNDDRISKKIHELCPKIIAVKYNCFKLPIEFLNKYEYHVNNESIINPPNSILSTLETSISQRNPKLSSTKKTKLNESLSQSRLLSSKSNSLGSSFLPKIKPYYSL